MPACLDVQEWRASTREEIVEFVRNSGKSGRKSRHLLAVRQHLRPVDVYSYLRARFGTPNGISFATNNSIKPDGSLMGQIQTLATPMRTVQIGMKLQW